MPQPREHATAAARQAAYRNRCDSARNAVLGAEGATAVDGNSDNPEQTALVRLCQYWA